MVYTWAHFALPDRLGSSPPRPAALSICVGDAQGAGAVGECQAFNAKTPVCVSTMCVDIAAFMPEMQLAFLQEVQR
jgi:hypothetical protein